MAHAMIDKTYGRGQAESALWRSFTGSSMTAPEEAPQIFKTRIKRLMELDRNMDLSDVEVPPEVDYAFVPPPSEQSGQAAYRVIDVFCLAIALDLLDAGYKQSEVVLLMYYLRPHLEDRLNDMLRPSSSDDKRLFVILRKVEMTEIIAPTMRQRFTRPVILEPIFAAGIEALGAKLDELMPNQRRTTTVLEVASTARVVRDSLEVAPLIRRGRPKT